jgi:ethanolamine ammonia-lyase small subunit
VTTLPVPPDPWADLRRHTPARIGLGRCGVALPTAEVLRLAAAHAQARDAVHVALDEPALEAQLQAQGWRCVTVSSRSTSRGEYLRRPDLGRRLATADATRLQELAVRNVDLAIVVGDGLSALAVRRHASPLLAALRTALGDTLTAAPLVIATQARVALADEIGALLQARVALILLGERPGLSSPDSLGAYLTHTPAIGRVDAERNCVSNIRPEGLPPERAAERIAWLLRESLRRGVSGVALKDDSATELLGVLAEARVNVRAPADEEVGHLAKLWYDGWQDAHSAVLPAELAKYRTLESFVHRIQCDLANIRVAGPCGRPVGFCMVKGDELYQLYVSALERGSGVAAALLADAEAQLAAMGNETAWLACAIGNERAKRFYEKHGWRCAGTMTSQLDTPDGLFPLEVWRYEKALLENP